MLFLTKGVREMLKKMMVVLGCMGIIASANANEGDTAARGLQTSLSNVNNEDALFSIMQDAQGEDGYLSVVIDEEVVAGLRVRRTSNGPLFFLSSSCSYMPSTGYGSEKQFVRVVRSEAAVVDDETVNITVQMLLGDVAAAPSSLQCTYNVGAEDIKKYGQSVFSIEYLIEKNHLDEEVFNFEVDSYQLMVDSSVAV